MADNTPGKRFKNSKDEQSSLFNLSQQKRSSTLRRQDGPQKAARVSYPKARAKNKVSIPTLLISIVLVVLVLIAVLYFGSKQVNSFIAERSADQVEDTVKSLYVEIPEGAGSSQIANLLKEAGVIESKEDFLKKVSTSGDDKLLKPGAYTFIAGLSIDEVIEELKAGGEQIGNKLVIPEGLRVDQVAKAVEKAQGISTDDFLAQAKASNYVQDYPFLEGVYNDSLEGFLFPKTYTVPKDANADTIIRMLLDQFKKETEAIDFSTGIAGEKSLTPYQVITIASLIERETKVEEEKAKIAQVIYNRLDQKMPLQIDAAIVYALGGKTDALTKKDLEVDSPYNIYKNQGLPPGPIASPSLSSIQAALAPEPSKNLYYVLTSKEGMHTFTESYEDFLKAKEEYKRVFGL